MKKESLILRIGIDLALVIAVVFSPWWISFPLAVMGGIFFSGFYEMIIIGLWIDSAKAEAGGSFFPIFFILSVIMIFVATKIKKQIAF